MTPARTRPAHRRPAGPTAGRGRVRGRSALAPRGAALLLGLGLVLAGCADDGGGAQVKGAVATFPGQPPGPARATLDTGGGSVTLDLDRCIAVEPGTLDVSGTAPDGGTIQVRIGAQARSVLFSDPDATQSGTVDDVSIDGGTRRFTVTGTLRPAGGVDRDGVGPYTFSGRCPT